MWDYFYRILEINEWVNENKYSVITALNLVDRIDRPTKLLHDIRKSVKHDGYVVLAIVLPYNPCYETGMNLVNKYQVGISGSFQVW